MPPESKAANDPDIYIVGLGIKGIDHITRETEAAIRRSKQVLAVSTHPAVLTHLRTLCPSVRDLHAASYRENENRFNAYDTMSASVIAAALEDGPVTFALYGHPLVYVYPSRQIMDVAPLFGLKVRMLPGISSLDTMIIDLGVDPAVEGIQMYEATDLLVKQRPLQPDVPCLLWQVGTVESQLFSTAASKPERFTRIREYLLRFYPPDHEMTAVYSTHHPLLPSTIVKFTLDDMEARHAELHPGLTVYIPPVGERPVADWQLVEEVDSVQHLDRVTQSS